MFKSQNSQIPNLSSTFEKCQLVRQLIVSRDFGQFKRWKFLGIWHEVAGLNMILNYKARFFKFFYLRIRGDEVPKFEVFLNFLENAPIEFTDILHDSRRQQSATFDHSGTLGKILNPNLSSGKSGKIKIFSQQP